MNGELLCLDIHLSREGERIFQQYCVGGELSCSFIQETRMMQRLTSEIFFFFSLTTTSKKNFFFFSFLISMDILCHRWSMVICIFHKLCCDIFLIYLYLLPTDLKVKWSIIQSGFILFNAILSNHTH